MSIRERLLLRFKKNQVVKVYILEDDRRMHTFYDLPRKDGTINIDGGKYKLDKNNFVYEKGIPAYFFQKQDPTALPLYKHDTKMEITATELRDYVDSGLGREAVNGLKDEDSVMKVMVMLIVLVIVGFAIMGYLMMSEIGTLRELLNEVYFGSGN